MQKGVSEVVSFVLIVAIMVTATMAAYIWASSSINTPPIIRSKISFLVTSAP